MPTMTATVLLLDARWPDMIPLNLAGQIRGRVEFSPEVPVSVRWALDVADGDGHWIITTDPKFAERVLDDDHVLVKVPSLDDPVAEAVRTMHEARRRGEWEQEMTHESLLPYLREEAEEVAEAIRTNAPDAELQKELSDLLLQVLFHAEIADERGAFGFGDVAGAFVAKMRVRAPYLFDGSDGLVDKATQDRLWAEGKASE